jgi:hypothetical protein
MDDTIMVNSGKTSTRPITAAHHKRSAVLRSAKTLLGAFLFLTSALGAAAQCNFEQKVGSCKATITAQQAPSAVAALELDIVISSSASCSKVVYVVGGMTQTSLLNGTSAQETLHASAPLSASEMKVESCTEFASLKSQVQAPPADEVKQEDPWSLTGKWEDLFQGEGYGLSSSYDLYENDGVIVGTGFLLWSRRDLKDGKPTSKFISGKRTGKKITITSRVPSLYQLDQRLKKMGRSKKSSYSYNDSVFPYRMTTPDSFANKSKTLTFSRSSDTGKAGDFTVDGHWRNKDGIRIYLLREKDGLISGVGSSFGEQPDEDRAAETIDLAISGTRKDGSVELRITDKSGAVTTERYTMRNSYSFWDETKPIFIHDR